MYIEFSFGLNNADEFFDLRRRITDLLIDKGRITDSGIMLIFAEGEL